MIQTDLEYAALAFTPSMNAGLRNCLLAVWRKAIRCAAGVGYQDEVTPLLSEFRLINIVDRWIVQFACYVRRCVKQEAPSTSCAKLQRPVHHHCTRGQQGRSQDLSGWFFYGLGGPNGGGVRGLTPEKFLVLRCLNPCFFLVLLVQGDKKGVDFRRSIISAFS